MIQQEFVAWKGKIIFFAVLLMQKEITCWNGIIIEVLILVYSKFRIVSSVKVFTLQVQ